MNNAIKLFELPQVINGKENHHGGEVEPISITVNATFAKQGRINSMFSNMTPGISGAEV